MNVSRSRRRVPLATIIASCVALHGARAQQPAYNPRDDQFRYLGMVRARAELAKASEEFDRASALAARGMLSRSELSDRRIALERVRVDYLQQSLATLLASARIVIDRAVKERRSDGSIGVLLRLRSMGGESAADQKARALIDSGLEATLAPDVIPTVFVSLKSEGGSAGTTISRPYELLLRNVRAGEARDVRFTLLKDVSDLVVATVYADKTDERRVLLDNAGTRGQSSLRATQFSLEGDFGSQVTYDLVLERAFTGNASVRLVMKGLPPAVAHEFRDVDSKARISQVQFPDGQTSRRLQLVLTVPSAAEGSVRPDSAVHFSVAAEADGTSATSAGEVALELIPRGIPRIELRTTNLYFETSPSDSVVTEVFVRNTGSRDLTRIAVAIDPSSNWTARVQPAEIEHLGLSEMRAVRVTLAPRGAAPVGDYENHLRVVSLANDRRLDDADKILRIRVESRTGLWATIALLTSLLAMTVGVVVAAKKLGRR